MSMIKSSFTEMKSSMPLTRKAPSTKKKASKTTATRTQSKKWPLRTR